MMSYMELACADIGVKEIDGPEDNQTIMAYYRDAGFSGIAHETVPWCMAFVGAILWRDGYPRTNTLTARDGLNYGAPSDGQVGDLAIFWRTSPKSWEGHIGFVAGFDEDGNIDLISGNVGDAVTREWVSRDRLLGFRTPVKATAEDLRPVSREIPMSEAAEKVSLAAAVMAAITQIMANLNQVFATVAGNYLPLVIVLLAVSAFFVFRWWKNRRIDRHKQGQPIHASVVVHPTT